MYRLFAAFVLVGPLMAAAPAQAAPSPASLNVQGSDLHPAPTLYLDVPETAKDLVAQDTKHTGVYRGVIRSDTRRFSLSTPGNTVLIAIVSVFRTPAAAHASLAITKRLVKTGSPQPGNAPLPSVGVGDEVLGIQGPSPGPDGRVVPTGVVLFRRHAYTGELIVFGTTKAFPATQVVRLARLVDARIVAASR